MFRMISPVVILTHCCDDVDGQVLQTDVELLLHYFTVQESVEPSAFLDDSVSSVLIVVYFSGKYLATHISASIPLVTSFR